MHSSYIILQFSPGVEELMVVEASEMAINVVVSLPRGSTSAHKRVAILKNFICWIDKS